MFSIIPGVFNATIGLLVNKGWDKATDKLKDCDVTDQKIREWIVREIYDIRSKLDGLARKDLLASISFFEEGIELLYDVFNNARSRSEYGMATTQATAGMTGAESVSLAERMRKLDLNDLDESAVRSLSNAKERFKDARRKATEAFNNEALELSDRVLAMQYRVMATILETVDNPVDALPSCRVCIEEMHRLSAVKDCFTVELKQGFWARFSKDERRALISSTWHVNSVIYDVIRMVCFGSEQLSANNWPCVDTGKEKVDPLRDHRVAKVLEKQGVKKCSAIWSFGRDGEEENKLKEPVAVAVNADGQFIVGDNWDKTVKVFDSSGRFILKIKVSMIEGKSSVDAVSTDEEGNIYTLVTLVEPGTQRDEARWTAYVLVYNSAGDQLRKFPVRTDSKGYRPGKLTVSNNKVLVAWGATGVVGVYQTDGGYLCSFGDKILKRASDITAGPDGRILVLDRGDDCIHIFTEDGQQQSKFSIRSEEALYYCVASHPGGEHVIVAGQELETYLPRVAIYFVDGECLRTVELDERTTWLGVKGIAISMEGRIAAAFCQGKVVVF